MTCKLMLTVALAGLGMAACGDDEAVKKLSSRVQAVESKIVARFAESDLLKKATIRIKALEAQNAGMVKALKSVTGRDAATAELLTAITARLDNLSKSVGAIKAGAGKAQDLDKRITGDIDRLSKRLDALKAEIKKVAKGVPSAATLRKLTRDVDRAREEVAVMTRTISAMSKRVADLEKATKTE